MTEFETQVADALKRLRAQWTPEQIRANRDLLDCLAPRVAAAEGKSGEAFLKALRGEQ